MLILGNAGGIVMTNSFLIVDELSKEAVVFDAPDHTTGRLLQEAGRRGWRVVGLWLTHGHFDHFADHLEVKKSFPDAQILIHQADAPKAQHPEIQTRLFGLPLVIQPLKPDGFVTDGQQLQIGNISAHVLHTPGHSPGHVCYYLPVEHLLIGGDLIIGGAVGRTDLPDSNHSQLEASIQKVMALPPKTRLLGGHGEPTTLEYERRNNPFVQEALAGHPMV